MKIAEVARTLLRGKRPLTCEGCGAPFDCGVSLRGCWCGDAKLSDAARAELRDKYRDCLCPACLRRLQDSQAST